MSTLESPSFEGDIFQNHSFSVKNNPIYEVSEQRINVLQDGTTNNHRMNNVVEEIRILIDEETIAMNFTNTLPTTNKIVISHSSREFSTRLMEITLGITGQAAVSLMAYVSTTTATTSSSRSLRGLNFMVTANAVGFIASFLGMWLSKKNKKTKRVAAASVVAGKTGGVATACAMIIAMGMFLPANVISIIWTFSIWVGPIKKGMGLLGLVRAELA
ncbi:hypothetical protein R3W88_013616 [Solanum pinnatisectum]|uniref:Uncharacterized protein n=1 Tax=Solanum pinnatisectum TaxID=50273 RepID=A0AAV9KQ50_9SOLN|nr:hypothetical protein R3W88_013616 [Solanum pinnatisectum]